MPLFQQRSRDGQAGRQWQRRRQHPLPSRFEHPLPRIEATPIRTPKRPAGKYWPTADDWEFYLVRVGKGERTCLGCGETFPADGYCARCGLPDPGAKSRNDTVAEKLPPSVATDSYLRPEEYRIV